ncbi:histidine decarboxylase [Acinetobacter gerneri]|uniref:histidine decarboxylase n=1 Tax=Acinetobacter gerneri TaxID=202952 RepID=UPI00293583B2|nr:histidine decarboxylase [Acinetobacter gerneri]MDV2438984.1 histidine decarboxylase [Acinetobacter gerneri]
MILSASDCERIEKFWTYCQKHQYFNIGYPESADFDYSALYRFFNFSINNCGDWQEPSNYALNSFDFEKDVMRYFAEYFRIAFDDSWGYVTNGGTEGNMFACYLARELFAQGTLYYSKATHYSVIKIAKLLQMKSCVVDCLENGEIDVADLLRKIQNNHEKNPIIFANIGTTMSGAIDNITQIQTGIAQLGITRDQYYIHADAALSGMILPFVDQPQAFSFADGIDSICVSGHKMIGSPIPCGIVLAKRENVERISVNVDYISARDQTISGSRNGHTVLLMWAAIRSQTFLQKKQRVQHCLKMAQYAVERFQANGINAWRNLNSITVVFPCPSEAVWKKHYLATSENMAHLITTAHHKDTQKIDLLIDDVIEDLRGKTQRTA